MSLVWRHKLGD